MRKYFLPILILLLLIPSYFLFAEVNPKYAGRFPFMVFLLAIDVYLWISLRKKISELPLAGKITATALYWLPLVAFIFIIIISTYRNLNLTHPALSTYILGIAVVVYFAKLITVIFFLLADIYRIALFAIRHALAKKKGQPMKERDAAMSRGKFLRTMGLATGGLFFSGLVIGMVKWAHDFRVKYIDLSLPKLPWSFDGMRVVQISDLHLGSWASTYPIEEAVDIINDLDADLVLFTGDLVNFSSKEAYRFRDILKRIESKHGVYSILGNHDYGDYVNWSSPEDKEKNMTELYDFYKDIGWKLLRNQNDVIDIDGEKVALLGVENWSASRRFPKLGNVRKALKGVEDIPVKILMSHDPTHWEKEVSVKYPQIGVTLSGHTHGFQFGVELKNFRWSFAQYVYKYWAGLYRNENISTPQYLYVNRGLGMIGYPGRVGILPEITLFSLRQSSES